jgi:tungstate transport system permease protein
MTSAGPDAAMNDVASAFAEAARLLLGFDADLREIVGLSLRVSLTAVAVASVIGLPAGAALALLGFPGRHAAIVAVNALMGLPPVVVGLVIYLLLSRSGPLGALGLLFTPTAMIVAQTVLITPIIVALSRQVIEDLWDECGEQLRSLGASPGRAIPTLLWDARLSLVTVVLAGFGRASAEVGAVMIVGGNIDHVTRVMTTAIALETSKGDLPLALGLGIVLIALSFAVNTAVALVRGTALRTGA